MSAPPRFVPEPPDASAPIRATWTSHIFNTGTAARFRKEILSRGCSDHPMTLYKNFRGEEPGIDALLRRNGIVKTER
jgi:Zn-dependent oligopeptidase